MDHPPVSLMPAPSAVPYRVSGTTLVLRVRLTPKGGRDSVDGIVETPDGPAIKARVRAAPENGAANAALTSLIADWLGVARSDITVIAGHKSRSKQLAIAAASGAIGPRLTAALAAIAD
jgi:uncharacterized protein YggU (UPF0235/DUF167 family)